MQSNQVKAFLKQIDVRGVVVVVVFVALGIFFTLHQKSVAPLPESAIGWKQAIERNGPEEAYKEFIDSNESLNAGTRHSNAHSFGAALYAAKGADGFPICKDYFDYGCAHGFIVRAIQVEGENVVGRFADSCRKQPYPAMCLHGIGHGLVSYLGYDDASYKHSVAICQDVVKDATTAGCIGGATMEFGLKSMSFGELSVAPITNETKYKPCTEAGNAAKSACYFWITGWWYSSLVTNEHLSAEDAVKKMGDYCAMLPEQEFTGECFAGIGDNVSMASGYDAKRSIEFCDASATDSSARMYCKAYAENILLGDKRTARDAPFLCDSEKAENKGRCDYLARRGVSVFDDK